MTDEVEKIEGTDKAWDEGTLGASAEFAVPTPAEIPTLGVKKKNGWGGARAGSGGARVGGGAPKGNKNALGHGQGRPKGSTGSLLDPTGAPTVILNLKVPMSQKIYVQEQGGAGFVRALIEAHQQGKLVL